MLRVLCWGFCELRGVWVPIEVWKDGVLFIKCVVFCCCLFVLCLGCGVLFACLPKGNVDKMQYLEINIWELNFLREMNYSLSLACYHFCWTRKTNWSETRPLELQCEEIRRPSLIPNAQARSICQQCQMGFICQVLDRGQQGLEPNKRRRNDAINLDLKYSLLIFFYLHNMKVINLAEKGPTGELSVTWRGLLHFEKNLYWWL